MVDAVVIDIRLKCESRKNDYDESKFADSVIFRGENGDVIIGYFLSLETTLELIVLSFQLLNSRIGIHDDLEIVTMMGPPDLKRFRGHHYSFISNLTFIFILLRRNKTLLKVDKALISIFHC
jgi:hypothetical protein